MEFERLEALSKRYFGDLSDLARAMGKHEKTFYPYKKGNFGRKILKDLEAFGIGEKFLSGESENPFADNEAGRALAQKFGTPMTTKPSTAQSLVEIARDVNESFRALDEFASRDFGGMSLRKIETDDSRGERFEIFIPHTETPYKGKTDQSQVDKIAKELFSKAPPKGKQAAPSNAHKWALIREWLTETGTVTEWYFRVQERVPDMTLDYLLSLEGLAQAQERQDLETLLWSFLIQNGVNVDWLLPNATSASPFIDSPKGEALVARLKARYAKRDTARESAAPSQYLEEELYSQDH